MPTIEHSFVKTRGFTTHVAQCGSGAPLILLHGWPEFWATWEPIFDRLADRYRLIAPDFRGFGESGNPDQGRSDQAGPDVLAQDIAILMKALGIAEAGFVGHDVGAYVMQRLALDHPGGWPGCSSSIAARTASARAGASPGRSTRSGTRPSIRCLSRPRSSVPPGRPAGLISAKMPDGSP